MKERGGKEYESWFNQKWPSGLVPWGRGAVSQAAVLPWGTARL